MRYTCIRQVCEEIIDSFFFSFNVLFFLEELSVVNDTSDHSLLLNIEVILHFRELCLKLLGLVSSPPLVSFALVDTLLPRIDLGSQLLIFLVNQFHIEHITQCLFLSVPLL